MIRVLGVGYRSRLDIQPCRGVYLSAKIAIYSVLQDELITFNSVFFKNRRHFTAGLFQFRQGFLDAPHGFGDVFVARCIAYAEAFLVAEGIAPYSCHMCFLEQVDGKV